MDAPQLICQSTLLLLLLNCVFISGRKQDLVGFANVNSLKMLPHDSLQLFHHLSHQSNHLAQTIFPQLFGLISLNLNSLTVCLRKPVRSVLPPILISIRTVVVSLTVASAPFSLISAMLNESQFPPKPPSSASETALQLWYPSLRSSHS